METNGAIEKPKGAHQVTYLVNWGQKGPYGFNGGHSETLITYRGTIGVLKSAIWDDNRQPFRNHREP